MKIQKIEIFGYGKWVDQTFYLEPNLNVFIGGNGSGKSTLMSFILSIMFGFPNMRRKHSRNYDVNPNVNYGGRLYLTDTIYGQVMIERIKQQGRQQLFMTVNDNPREEVSSFDELFEGLSKEDYLTYFGFDEEDLIAFVWEDEDQFAKSLVSLGVSGRQVLNGITPELEAQAADLYLPNGQKPQLNQELNQVAASSQRLDQAAANEQNYFALEEELQANQAELEGLRQQESQAQDEQVKLQIASQETGSVEEKNALGFELAGYDFHNFPEGAAETWHDLNQDLARYEDQMDQTDGFLVLDEDQAEEEPSQDSLLTIGQEWVLNHDHVSDQMLAEARAYREQLNSDEALKEQLIQKRYEEHRLLAALGAESIDELPEELTASERQEWQNRRQELDNRRIFYENTKHDLQDLMAENQDLHDEYDEVQSEYNSFKGTIKERTSSWLKTFGLILIVLALILAILYFVTDKPFMMGSGLAAGALGALFTIIGFLQSGLGKRSVKKESQAFDLDLRDIESEQAEIQRRIDIQNDQLAELENESQNFMAELQALVQEKGGSEYIQPLIWLDHDYVAQINALEAESNQLIQATGAAQYAAAHDQEWQDYAQAISNNPLSQDSVFQAFEDDYHSLRQLEMDHAFTAQTYQAEKNQKQELHQSIHSLRRARQDFLDRYGFESADEVEDVLAKEAEMLAKKERFDLLNHSLNPQAAQLHDKDETIDQQLEDNVHTLGQLTQRIQDLVQRNAQLEMQIRELEASGLVSKLQADHASDVDQAYDSAVEWAANKMAVATFEQASVGEEGEALERVLGHANRYLYDLSNGELEKLRYQNETVEVLSEDNLWLAVDQLSRGEKALLFVAMRFAFLNAQLGQLNMPILIDEAFAHIDDYYRQNIYRFLDERSQDQQIILLTIDESAALNRASKEVTRI
ncbi:ATP-binding protein [Aerococcus sanguinicola]|uniref:ATP-binding protein n=1 Tax=Aerococcus sanguinicola TaxID=119206 RepID=UPI0018A7DE92|nr:AAA family ATPase [Aerococcus sanguinicola]